MKIDHSLLLLIFCITCILNIFILIVQYFLNRKYRGLGFWVLGLSLSFVGQLILLLSDDLNAIIPFLARNLLTFLGLTLVWIGLKKFLALKVNIPIILALSLAFVLCNSWSLIVHHRVNLDTFALIMATVYFLATRDLIIHKIETVRTSSRFVSILFLVVGILVAIRGISIFFLGRENFIPTTMFSIVQLAAITMSILLTFGFIIMIHQRLVEEQRLIEQSLSESRQIYQSLFDQNPSAVFSLNLEGFFTSANQVLAEKTELPIDTILGKHYSVFAHPSETEKIKTNFEKSVKGATAAYEIKVVTARSHTVLNVMIMNLPIIVNGNITGVYCIVNDITHERVAQLKLQQSEENLKEAQEIAKIGSWEFFPQTGKLFWSREHYQIFEMDEPQPEDLLYELCKRQMHREDVELLDKKMEEAIKTGQGFEFEHRILFPDGRVKYLLGISKANKAGNHKTISLKGIVQDITERKLAQEKLDASKNELEHLFNTIDDNLFSTDLVHYRPLQMSQACEKIYGYPPSAFLENPNLWKEVILPEDVHIIDKNYDAMNRGEQLDMMYRILHKDGSIRWLNTVITPTLDENGKAVRIDGITKDITGRKMIEAEIIALNESLELKVKQRTEELESFAYSVSHDLRSPLRVINGFARILKTDYKEKLDKEGIDVVNFIADNARRMDNLIEDLLKLSRLGKFEMAKKSLNIMDMLSNVIDELKFGSKDGTSAEFVVHDLPPALGDEGLMKQVWLNLISNGIKYSSKTAQPRIEIGCIKKEGRDVYYVKDNGVGFSMKHADKLFGVFQRLHSQEDFEGTGVGLAIVSRIIHRHGGKIYTESEIDKGATFYFYL